MDRFCMRATKGAVSFGIEGGAEYNYRRTRRPGEPYESAEGA
jgi:hypothetical protein